MAVVQYTAIVNQLRGKLNGSVFNKGKNAFTLQRKQQPSKQNSYLQLIRRSRFSAVQRSWKATTPAQKASASLCAQLNPTRDRFGQEVSLSGYNQFVKCNLLRLMSERPLLMALVPASMDAYLLRFDSSFSEFSELDDGRLSISTGASVFSLTSNPNTIDILCYISLPHSRGVTNYTGRWFFSGFKNQAPGSLPIGAFDLDFITAFGVDYPVPEAPQQILIRLDIVGSNTGALVQRIEHVSTY